MRTGVYTYQIRRFDGSFEQYKMPIEIVAEHPTMYRIKFLHVHADGRGFGTLTWVHKKHVYMAHGAKSLQTKSNYYLPYKD
jgi:hypothetical protein